MTTLQKFHGISDSLISAARGIVSEGKRGRPAKVDANKDEGPEPDQNILVHLRKSVDTNGTHEVTFGDGGKHKVAKDVAHHVLSAVEKLKPEHRAKVQSHIQASHDNLIQLHQGLKSIKEDVEQIDELSKKTLGMYLYQAGKSKESLVKAKEDGVNAHQKLTDVSYSGHIEPTDRTMIDKVRSNISAGINATKKKIEKRDIGAFRALRRLTKEDVDITESKVAITLYQQHHARIKELLKGINAGLDAHKAACANNCHHGHVGDLREYGNQLQSMHDSLYRQGEFADK